MKLCSRVSAFAALLALVPFCGRAETLIRLDLPQDYSRLAVREMKAELGRIVEDAGLDLRWQPRSSPVRMVEGRTISVALRGQCSGRTPPTRETGPLGWTKAIDGLVLPYIEISCARLESLIDRAWGNESAIQRELLFGRALGRVLAHELAHALTRTRHHSSEGLRERSLSLRDLVSGTYRMTSSDFERLRPEPQLAAAYVSDRQPGQPAILDSGGR